MVRFPNCKINLGLHITGKRPDGFHALETIFYPVPLCDILELVTSTTLTFQSTGLSIPGNTDSNLCLKAYHLLKQDFPNMPPVQMHLHKIIPMGAGLGGGSADGAFALSLLNEKFSLGLTQAQLIDYALQLGSDCPFFIINQPCYATGRGEQLTPLSLDLSNHYFVLVNPAIHISTKWAFEQITPAPSKIDLKEIVQTPIEAWRHQLFNDFEIPISKAHPAIGTIKNQLYELGASYAAMTGSGSTVFGIFKTKPAQNLTHDLNYNAKIVRIN